MTAMNKKILLFAPRPSAFYWGGEPWPLLAVSRFLVQGGYEVKVVQSLKGEDYADAVRREAPGCLLFGVSCMTGYSIHESIEASRAFKETNPEAPVVWGGWHPSIMPMQVLESPYADIAVVGQGERSIIEIAELALQGKKPAGVAGVVYKDGGKIISNLPRPFEDVNNFPPMPYDILDIKKNLTVTDLGTRTLRYVSSQGCPHRCGFCVEPTVFGRRWYGLNAERVVSEVEALVKEYGVNGLVFTDSNFFVDKKRVKEIASLFVERGLNISWGNANGRTKQLLALGDETWDLLKRSGLKSILIGAESGIQEGLDLIHKDTTVGDTVNLAKLCSRYGIKITFSLMIGLPYDEQDRTKQAELVKKEYDAIIELLDSIYRSQTTPNFFLLFVYTPYPGTPLYQLSLKLGMEEPRKLEDWVNFELNMRNTPWVPEKYIARAEMLSSYIFRWLDTPYLEKLKGKKSPFMPLYVLGGYVFTAISRLRWRLKFFSMPVDYWLFRLALKHMKSGPD